MNTVLQNENTNSIENVEGDSMRPSLQTIKGFCSQVSWPSESAMRSYVYRAPEMGIEGAFVRVGRRVLVDGDKFFKLIQQVEDRVKPGGNYAGIECGKQR
jgi:hypothetical protein